MSPKQCTPLLKRARINLRDTPQIDFGVKQQKKICFREKLRCLNVANNRLETLYEMVDNKQLVRDSWIHEKVNQLHMELKFKRYH